MTNDTQAQHTSGPLVLSGNGAYSEHCKDRGRVFECNLRTGTHIPDDQNEVNAERLARIWNSHDALLEACKDIRDNEFQGTYPEQIAVLKNIARAALALAERGAE